MAATQPTTPPLPEANQFANFLIALSRQEGRKMSAYKLQKLLYYVQAWSYTLRSRPAFAERVKAWVDGPVVPAVYKRFVRCFYVENTIPPDHKLPPEDCEHAYSVWMTYREFDGDQLSEMTHKEAPWLSARRGYGPNELSDMPIDPRLMQQECNSQLADTDAGLLALAEASTRAR